MDMSVDCEVKGKWLRDSRTQSRLSLNGLLCQRMRRVAGRGMSLLVLACSGGVVAAVEGDPTAPPPEWLALQPTIAGKLVPRTEAVKEVQVVIIGRDKRLAVIDGKVVKVGDEYEGSKIAAVKASQVINEDAAKTILVTPAVSKKMPVKRYPQKKDVLIVPVPDEVTNATGAKP